MEASTSTTMDARGWQSFGLTIAKMVCGTFLYLHGEHEFGMLLMGAGIYASGANGWKKKEQTLP